jgi:hypothetical protein
MVALWRAEKGLESEAGPTVCGFALLELELLLKVFPKILLKMPPLPVEGTC